MHGDRYDYSGVVYNGAKTVVSIGCIVHGRFSQTPQDHLKGSGCPRCAKVHRKSTQECLADFVVVHGSRYNYAKVVYASSSIKVEILCKEHGSFFQTPNHHLEGKGCPKCSVCNQDTLYVLKCNNTGLYKIGITNNLEKRRSSIGGNLEHIYHITTENPRDLEKYLHQRY